MIDMKPGEFSHLTLSELFQLVDSADLALPELQRPAVWQDSKIPDLLDSVYRDFPFGTMLIWTPSAGDPIQTRRFRFSRDGSLAAKHYLIDGQQRLTAFYRSLNQAGGIGKDHTIEVAFNLEDEEFSLVDGQIRSMLQKPRDHGWYLVRHLLKMPPDELQRLRGRHDLENEKFDAIFSETGRIRRLNPDRITITVYNIVGRSYREVVEIFDRINRGMPVKQSQKVLAVLSADYPGVVGEVEDYLEKSADTHGRDFDLDFFVGTLALVAKDRVEIESIPEYYEEEYEDDAAGRSAAIKADVHRTIDSINRALEFMDRHLGMNTLKRIPYTRTMSCLAYAIGKSAFSPDDPVAARQAAHWISRSLLTGFHDAMSRFKWDVSVLAEADHAFPFIDLRKNLRSFGIERETKAQINRLNDIWSAISRNDPLFDFVYAILRKTAAVSFPSKKSMQSAGPERDADELPKTDSEPSNYEPTLHQHHIYPLARLLEELDSTEDEWLTRPRCNDIGNLTFILTEDNLKIADASIEYLREIDAEIREQHMIGECDYAPGEYKAFLKDRRKLIRDALTKYMDEFAVD